jgi:general secretion pathway protein G
VKRIGIALVWTLAGLLTVPLALVLLSPGFTLELGHYNRSYAAKAQIAALLDALQTYRADTSSFPTEEQGLQALRADPGVPGWKGPYLSKDIPVDPWGRPYRYSVIDGHPHIASRDWHEPIAASR